jgi:hypothetical protein
MHRSRALRLLTIAVVLTAGCRELPSAARNAFAQGTAAASLVPLDEFGIGAGGRGNGCRAPEYRQFDFWIGNWNIRNANDQPAGVSEVYPVLGGCAVIEKFLGGAGLSLNAYDEGTRAWNQFYVFAQGGILLLRGAFRNDSMILSERRGPAVNDVWVWTLNPDSSVTQQSTLFVNDTARAGFLGRYVRRATPPNFPAPGVTNCAAAAWRQMDFLIGTWDVHEGSTASAPQGTLTVTTDASKCILMESLAGRAEFEALGFGSYHPQARRWFRSYMDTDGRYLLMSGTQSGNRMTLSGSRVAANGATVLVRVSWESETADRVLQRWELSSDGGASWHVTKDYTFTRR